MLEKPLKPHWVLKKVKEVIDFIFLSDRVNKTECLLSPHVGITNGPHAEQVVGNVSLLLKLE